MTNGCAKTGPPRGVDIRGYVLKKMPVSVTFNKQCAIGIFAFYRTKIGAARQCLLLHCHNGGDRMYLILPYRLTGGTLLEGLCFAQHRHEKGDYDVMVLSRTE